jgi:hypothetical protein
MTVLDYSVFVLRCVQTAALQRLISRMDNCDGLFCVCVALCADSGLAAADLPYG